MKHLSKKIAMIASTLALVVVLGVVLAACGDSAKALTYEEYKKNLEAAEGYTISTDYAKPSELTGTDKSKFEMLLSAYDIKIEDVKWYLQAGSGDDMPVTIMELNSEDAAKKVASALKEQYKSAPKGYSYDRMGTVVIDGPDAAIKAAQGK